MTEKYRLSTQGAVHIGVTYTPAAAAAAAAAPTTTATTATTGARSLAADQLSTATRDAKASVEAAKTKTNVAAQAPAIVDATPAAATTPAAVATQASSANAGTAVAAVAATATAGVAATAVAATVATTTATSASAALVEAPPAEPQEGLVVASHFDAGASVARDLADVDVMKIQLFILFARVAATKSRSIGTLTGASILDMVVVAVVAL